MNVNGKKGTADPKVAPSHCACEWLCAWCGRTYERVNQHEGPHNCFNHGYAYAEVVE